MIQTNYLAHHEVDSKAGSFYRIEIKNKEEKYIKYLNCQGHIVNLFWIGRPRAGSAFGDWLTGYAVFLSGQVEHLQEHQSQISQFQFFDVVPWAGASPFWAQKLILTDERTFFFDLYWSLKLEKASLLVNFQLLETFIRDWKNWRRF